MFLFSQGYVSPLALDRCCWDGLLFQSHELFQESSIRSYSNVESSLELTHFNTSFYKRVDCSTEKITVEEAELHSE